MAFRFWQGLICIWRILAMVVLSMSVSHAQVAPPRRVRVAVFNFYPGIFWDQAAGEAKGFYVDILQEVATMEQWELQFVPGSWADGLERVQTGEVDLLTSVAYSQERSKFLSFGKESSFTVWSLLFTHPDIQIQSILEIANQRIGVMRNDMNGGNFRKLCEGFKIQCTFVEFDSFSDVLKAIETRKVDAGVTASTFGYAKEHEFKVRRSPVVVSPFDIFFATAQGKNLDLLDRIDDHLRTGKANRNSGYHRALERWLYSHTNTIEAPPWLLKAGLFTALILLASWASLLVFRRRVRLATTEIRTLNASLQAELDGRARQEAATREEQQLRQQIINNAQAGVIVYGPDSRYQVWNPFMEELTGIPASEVLGKLPTEVFPFLAGLGLLDRINRALSGELVSDADFEFHVPTTGRTGWATDRCSPLLNAKGDIIGVIGMVTDITKRKLAENYLRNSEQGLLEILNSLEGLVYVADMETYEILFINKFGLSVWGDVFGQTCWKVLQADQTSPCDFCTNRFLLRPDGTPAGTHAWEFRNTVTGRWYECRDTAITWPDKRIVRLEIAIDITERKEAEEHQRLLESRLQHSTKMDSLGTLAGGVAHDMNNVLGAILGLASAHIGTQPTGSPLHRALDTICKATERGGKMVKSLLSFARQSPAEERELDMNAILLEQISLLERTTLEKVHLETDLEAELRPILGDASALAHAFMNLCVNAVDAMPANGTLILHSRNVDNDWIEVIVEDNGTGMPMEVLEKATEPFFTTKEIGKGTGLGLSMVFSTVKAHGGQMAIESEPGQGTRVMMRFPACEQEAPAQVEPPVAEPTVTLHRILKVLLIDDDDLIQSSVQAILEVLGHTALNTAQSGEAALTMLEHGLEVDLVILDMNMPGLGGIGTLPRLRALRPEVPVLLATGRVDQTALTLALAHPGVTLLSKPFGLSELQKHLETNRMG